MAKGRGPYRRHDSDFIEETIALVKNSKKPVASIARDLGIHSSTIYYWLKKKKDNVDLNIDGNTSPEAVRHLKRELEEVRLERDILKKVVAIFSKQPK